MRLIDADELDIYDVSPAYGMCVMGVTQEDIDDAPTVDAIPVSWIKENKNLARTVGAWQYELFLDTLLKDWEEERKEE